MKPAGLFIALAALIATILLLRCSFPTLAGDDRPGTGSEVIAITGTIYYVDSIPAAGIMIYVREQDTNAGPDRQTGPNLGVTSTDSSGQFSLTVAAVGNATIEAVDSNGLSVQVRINTTVEENATLPPVRATLRPSALLVGRISTPLSDGNRYTVAIAGLRRFAADTDGFFATELPAGSYILSISDPLQETVPVRMNVDSLDYGEIRDLGVLAISPATIDTTPAIVHGRIYPAPTMRNQYQIQVGTIQSTVADNFGNFSLQLRAGSYTLIIINRRDSASTRTTVPLRNILPGENRDLGVINFPADTAIRYGWVTGVIVPPPSVLCEYAVLADGVNPVFADEKGAFRLKLPAGDHLLEIIPRRDPGRSVKLSLEALQWNEERNLGIITL